MALSVPVIAITMGDPAGIGPELAVRIAADPKWSGRAEFVIYGGATGFCLGSVRPERFRSAVLNLGQPTRGADGWPTMR